jgi:heme exporter protein D
MPDFDAGKYALYVWPAFAVTAAAFAWMIVDTLARARRWKRELDRLSRRDGE